MRRIIMSCFTAPAMGTDVYIGGTRCRLGKLLWGWFPLANIRIMECRLVSVRLGRGADRWLHLTDRQLQPRPSGGTPDPRY
jgi:hypothetical protein